MNDKQHLVNILALINIKARMNWGLSDALMNRFSNAIPIIRPTVNFSVPLDPYWVAGFTSGDGSFTITINVESNQCRVRFKFNLTQHIRDIKLMNYLTIYFGCGSVYINRDTASFNVYGFASLNAHIIPFFSKYWS